MMSALEHVHWNTSVEKLLASVILQIIHASYVSFSSSILSAAHSLNSSILSNPQRALLLKELRLPLLASWCWQCMTAPVDNSGYGWQMTAEKGVVWCVWRWGDYEDKVSMGDLWTPHYTHNNTSPQPRH